MRFPNIVVAGPDRAAPAAICAAMSHQRAGARLLRGPVELGHDT